MDQANREQSRDDMSNVRELTDQELEATHIAARQAIRNCCNHAKRELLDYVDFVKRTILRNLHPEAQKHVDVTLEMIKKRVHNDLSLVVSQGYAILEIYRNGGAIPPFGRSDDGSVTDPMST